MTAHIIDFRDYLPEKNPGSNGGREAMNKALAAVFPYETGLELTDDVLANLWFLGFKIVPVGDDQ